MNYLLLENFPIIKAASVRTGRGQHLTDYKYTEKSQEFSILIFKIELWDQLPRLQQFQYQPK